MFKIETGASATIALIAIEFYNKLNPRKKSGVLYKNALTKKILRKYSSVNEPRKKYFYNLLIRNNYKLLKNIIKGTPDQLEYNFLKFERLAANNLIPSLWEEINGVFKATDFGEEVRKVFDYAGCRGTLKFNWWAHQIDNKICPYCNYEQTLLAEDFNNEEKILFSVDHFIPKVKAPYLSLSFYNLLPSCHNCNSNYKGASIFLLKDHIHPYNDDFDSIYKVTIDKTIMSEYDYSFKILFSPKNRHVNADIKAINHIDKFGLTSRYNNDSFKKEILHLNYLKNHYSESFKNEILSGAIKGFPRLNDRNELLKYIAKHHNIPHNRYEASEISMGKLKLDIAIEFEILK